MARDLVAVVQGATYGCLMGILLVIALAILPGTNAVSAEWDAENRTLIALLALALVVSIPIRGTIRGALAEGD